MAAKLKSSVNIIKTCIQQLSIRISLLYKTRLTIFKQLRKAIPEGLTKNKKKLWSCIVHTMKS